MPRSFEGDLNAEGLRFGIVASRFNNEIVSGLLDGAIDCLTRHGARDEDIAIYRVPGAFEIPTIARELASQYDALITVGFLLRCDKRHFHTVLTPVVHDIIV